MLAGFIYNSNIDNSNSNSFNELCHYNPVQIILFIFYTRFMTTCMHTGSNIGTSIVHECLQFMYRLLFIIFDPFLLVRNLTVRSSLTATRNLFFVSKRRNLVKGLSTSVINNSLYDVIFIFTPYNASVTLNF